KFKRYSVFGEGMGARRCPARDLNVNDCFVEGPGRDGLMHSRPQPLDVDAINLYCMEASLQPPEVLLLKPRASLVNAQHLVDRIDEKKAAIERRYPYLGQRHALAINVGQCVHG